MKTTRTPAELRAESERKIERYKLMQAKEKDPSIDGLIALKNDIDVTIHDTIDAEPTGNLMRPFLEDMRSAYKSVEAEIQARVAKALAQ